MAYQIIHDELMLDGNARLNLATFVTTHMEPEAERLMAETFDKNMIDKDEYRRRPSLRCAASTCSAAFGTPRDRLRDRMLDHGLQRGRHARRSALKRRWQQRRRRGEHRAAQTCRV